MALTFSSAAAAGRSIVGQTTGIMANQLRPLASGFDPSILTSPSATLAAAEAPPIVGQTAQLSGGIGRSIIGAFRGNAGEGLLRGLLSKTKDIGKSTIGLLKSIAQSTAATATGGTPSRGGSFKRTAFVSKDYEESLFLKSLKKMQKSALVAMTTVQAREAKEEQKYLEKDLAREKKHEKKEDKKERVSERKQKRKEALEKFMSSRPMKAAAIAGGNLRDTGKAVVKSTTGFLSWILNPKNLLITGMILGGLKKMFKTFMEDGDWSLASFIEGASFGLIKKDSAQKVLNQLQKTLIGTDQEPGLLIKGINAYKDWMGIGRDTNIFAGTAGVVMKGLADFFIGTSENGYKDGLLGLGYNSLRKVLEQQGITGNLPDIKDISMGGAAVGAVIGAALVPGIGLIPGAIIGALAPGYLKSAYNDPGGPLAGMEGLFSLGGAISGAAIGFAVGGPPGALIGAIVGGLSASFIQKHLQAEGERKGILDTLDLSPEEKKAAEPMLETLTKGERTAFRMMSPEDQKRMLQMEPEAFGEATSEGFLGMNDDRDIAFKSAEKFNDALDRISLDAHGNIVTDTGGGESALELIAKQQGVGVEELGLTTRDIEELLAERRAGTGGLAGAKARRIELFRKMKGGGIEASFPDQESGGTTARNISGEHIVVGNLGDKTIVPPAEPLNFVTTGEMGSGIAASIDAYGAVTKAAIISGMAQFTNAHSPPGQGANPVIVTTPVKETPDVGARGASGTWP